MIIKIENEWTSIQTKSYNSLYIYIYMLNVNMDGSF